MEAALDLTMEKCKQLYLNCNAENADSEACVNTKKDLIAEIPALSKALGAKLQSAGQSKVVPRASYAVIFRTLFLPLLCF